MAAALAALLTGCGGSSGSKTPRAHAQRRQPATLALTAVSASSLGTLPTPVQDAAAATLPDGRVVLLGGIDSSGGSTGAVTILNGGHAQSGGELAAAQHDAQGALLGSDVYVFGGGALSSFNHIIRYDPAAHSVTGAGTLPSDASDVAVTSIGDTAYIVGGYDGSSWLDTILAWTPGRGLTPPVHVVGRLPTGLRYAAVAAVGQKLIIAGGTEPGAISDAILSFDTATGSLKRIGTLSGPLTHASAVSLDGRAVIVGGKRALTGGQTSAVQSVDPATGAVTVIGHLPQPLSDAAVAPAAGGIIVAGGDNGTGPQAEILTLKPVAAAR